MDVLPVSPPEQRLYVSTVSVQGDRDLPVVLARLATLGIRRVELSAPHPHLAEEELSALLGGWRAEGMDFVLHNYFPRPAVDFVFNLGSANPVVRQASIDLARSALALARRIEAPLYGCHAGYLADAAALPSGMFSFDGTTRVPAGECLATVAEVVAEISRGPLPPFGLLIENLFPDESGADFSIACGPGELSELFAAVDDARIGLLLDLAHLKLTCAIRGLDPDRALDDILTAHGHRLRAVHISDNDGRRDGHLAVDPQGWPLAALRRIAGLKDLGGRVLVTLESRRLDDQALLRQRDLLIAAMQAA